jgi:phosphatidylethanolamine/phosphatidyl-N-methylethanolamine N-methyltransferase
VIQGDAYRIQHLLGGLLKEPAAAVVSGLPLQTKPFKQRTQLIDEAFELMAPGAPFVQFTYAMVTPIPKRAKHNIHFHASGLIWQNLPPARVWVYRKG